MSQDKKRKRDSFARNRSSDFDEEAEKGDPGAGAGAGAAGAGEALVDPALRTFGLDPWSPEYAAIFSGKDAWAAGLWHGETLLPKSSAASGHSRLLEYLTSPVDTGGHQWRLKFAREATEEFLKFMVGAALTPTCR
jgi:hypothetical protein